MVLLVYLYIIYVYLVNHIILRLIIKIKSLLYNTNHYRCI
jgi:hypothetical protein